MQNIDFCVILTVNQLFNNILLWVFIMNNIFKRNFSAMIFAGIAGNSFDRAFHGAVIDFIHIHYYDLWHYPVFNVADIAICTGVGIYILSGFLRKTPDGKK